MKLSIVTTLFQSAPYLQEFCRRSIAAAEKLVGDDFEIVLVNDGSPDNSLAEALKLHRGDNRIKVVDLSRNFGHHKAMMAGLHYCSGNYVFLIDSDLEEQPEWLQEFAKELEAFDGVDKIDVVFGVQKRRKGNLFERVTGSLFFRLFNYLSDVEIPVNLVTARLMRRRYVDALLHHEEREYFISGLFAITGFNQRALAVEKLSQSPSSYSFSAKVALAAHHVICFSTKPLQLLCFLGLLIATISALIAATITIRRLSGEMIEGWASIVVVIFLLGGLNLFGIGVVGLYIGKIFSEVKRRPTAIVRELHD